MSSGADILPDDIETLRAALATERAARLSAEARATGAEAMIAHLKLLIAKLQRDRFGPTSERSRRLLDQLELQLEELEADTAEADTEPVEPPGLVPHLARARPVRGPLPAHLPRERVVIPGPTVCPCCNGRLTQARRDSAQAVELKIYDRCRCGDHLCGTFYTSPRPWATCGPNDFTVGLSSTLNADVVDARIVAVEVLHREGIRSRIHAAVP